MPDAGFDLGTACIRRDELPTELPRPVAYRSAPKDLQQRSFNINSNKNGTCKCLLEVLSRNNDGNIQG